MVSDALSAGIMTNNFAVVDARYLPVLLDGMPREEAPASCAELCAPLLRGMRGTHES